MNTSILLMARLAGRRTKVWNWRGSFRFSRVDTLPSSGCSWTWGDRVGTGSELTDKRPRAGLRTQEDLEGNVIPKANPGTGPSSPRHDAGQLCHRLNWVPQIHMSKP